MTLSSLRTLVVAFSSATCPLRTFDVKCRLFVIKHISNKLFRGRELNLGLPHDRRKYYPLYYHGSDCTLDSQLPVADQKQTQKHMSIILCNWSLESCKQGTCKDRVSGKAPTVTRHPVVSKPSSFCKTTISGKQSVHIKNIRRQEHSSAVCKHPPPMPRDSYQRLSCASGDRFLFLLIARAVGF